MATSLWGSLIKSGYRVVYALQIDGIPYIFAAGEIRSAVTASAVDPPTGDYTISNSLIIRDGMKIGIAADREKGLATGRAVEFTIGRQQIADESLGPALFMRPTLRANVTTTVASSSTTTFDVDSTSGWPSSGSFYIGREFCTYSGKTSTTFTGITRGVCGYPYMHAALSYGSYRQCTDVPVYWRGRLVTLWRHLVSPEGRYLGDTLCTLGDYCDQEWRGFIRDSPRPAQEGMTIACLPLVRLGAMEFGCELQGKIARDPSVGVPYIVAENSDRVFVSNPSLTSHSHPLRGFNADYAIMSMHNYAALVQVSINADDSTWRCQVRASADGLDVLLPESVPVPQTGFDGPLSIARGEAWFLGESSSVEVDGRTFDRFTGSTYYYYYHYRHRIPYRWTSHPGAYNRGAWLVIQVEAQEETDDATIGATGLLALDYGNGGSEVVTYTETLTSYDGTLRAFRIGTRRANESSWSLATDGGSANDPWLNETTVRVISGHIGSWATCLRTIMTSSGLGDRGDEDTLPLGFGASLPSSWIAEGDLANVPGDEIQAITTGKTTVEKLLCGWLALARMCLIQKRNADGAIVLDVVSTDVVDDAEAGQLTAADVLLDGHDTPELIEAPNHIKIAASDAFTERPTHVVRDAARSQAEGVRTLEVVAPGIDAVRAVQLGGEMLLLGDGQSLVKARLPPWVDVESGDHLEVTTEHPAIWDWATGAFAPSSVLGTVVSHERDLYAQGQEIEILLAGQAAERINLCPAALVIDVPGHSTATLLHVARGDSTGFRAADVVLVYERSNDDGDNNTAEIVEVITDVTYDAGVTYYDTIEVDADPDVTGDELVITYADYGDAVTRQRRCMYVRSDKEWR